MGTRFLTRSLRTNKQTISSALSRSYTSLSLSPPPSISLLRLLPLAANFRHFSPYATSVRGFAIRHTTSSANDWSSNASDPSPKDTILEDLDDGCDFEHWSVLMETPEGNPTRDEMIHTCIKTLATVVGSEEEARMKIYSVSTRQCFLFGALISQELSDKLRELPGVRNVVPDSYLDIKNKEYGGEPFINGQPVPYDPKYYDDDGSKRRACAYETRKYYRAKETNRPNDRRNNFERRDNMRIQMANQGMQNVGPNIEGVPSSNIGGGPNVGGLPPSNMGGGMQHDNMGGEPNIGDVPRTLNYL